MAFGGTIWLALLVLPLLLVLAYLLSRRDESHVVSSLNLWRTVSSESLSSRRLTVRRVDAALLLGVSILACLSLSAADPWIVKHRPLPAFAVVLDGSPSMEVRDASATARRIEIARDAALDALREAAASPKRLLLFGGEPMAAVTSGSGESTSFGEALSGVAVAEDDVPLEELAVAATAWVARMGGGRVLVISDFAAGLFSPPEQSGGDVVLETIVVGEAAPNVAVTSVTATPTLAGDTVASAIVANTGPDAERIELSAGVGGNVIRTESLDLDPGASAIWSFRLDAGAGDLVEVGARPGGALSVDDKLRQPLPLPWVLKDDGNLPVELSAALEMLPGLPTTMNTAGSLSGADATGVVEVFTDRLPSELPPRWIFLPLRGTAPDSIEHTPIVIDVVDERGRFLDRYQPLLVEPAALPDSTPPAGAIPVAFAAGRPAVALVVDDGTRGVWSGVAWEATSLASSGELPLLLSDMMRWLAVGYRPEAAPGPNLSPDPPPGARKAPVEVASPPASLRFLLLLAAAVLILLEAARRLTAWESYRRAVREIVPLTLALLLLFVSHTAREWTTIAPGALAVLLDSSDSASAATTRLLERLPTSSPLATLSVGAAADGFAGPRTGAFRSGFDLPAPTDLARGIDRAAHWVLASGGGSIFVVTDGRDPARRIWTAAERSTRQGVDIHVVPVVSPKADVAVETLYVPTEVRAEEIFEAVAVVRSNVDQEVTVTLERDAVPLAAFAGALSDGVGHGFRFLLRAPRASGEIVAHVEGPADENPSNNLARAHLVVRGRPRLAVIGYEGPPSGNVEAWDRLPPQPILDRYDGVLLRLDESFVPTATAEETLAAFVRTGRGLVVTCADPAVAGALRGGPIEAMLPVRLEPPDRPAEEAALVFLIDRSGSMERITSGRPALALAGDAVRAVAELLDDRDRYGVIAFDVAPHVLRPLATPRSGVDLASSASAVAAEGGTDWAPALDLALDWLVRDQADFRHVILIGDGRLAPGATGEPTRPWPDGVTLSTVSVGDDADRALMARLAARRDGRHDHVSRPDDLPRTLRREAAHSRLPEIRSGPGATVKEPSFAALIPAVGIRRGAQTLVVDAKSQAEIALRTEAGDPLLAFGRAGWGAIGFLATDPDALEPAPGARTGPEGLLQMALARVAGGPGAAASRVIFDGAVATVELLVDEETRRLPDARVRWPTGETLPLTWVSSAPGRLESVFAPRHLGEYLIEVDRARTRLFQATAPELARLNPDPDWAARLARAGKGTVVPVSREGGITLPRVHPRRVIFDLGPVLIALAAIVFFASALSEWRRRSCRIPRGHP